MTDRPLFDVDRTVPTACPVPGCNAIRLPGQDKVTNCQVDAARAVEWTARPKACLNQFDPTANPWPEGF
jgi:hypothetical protein